MIESQGSTSWPVPRSRLATSITHPLTALALFEPDRLLGAAEAVLVALSVAAMAIALRTGLPRLSTGVGLGVLVLALTVAQPFGVSSSEISASDYRHQHPATVGYGASTETMDLFGLPVLRFRPTRLPSLLPPEDVGISSGSLRVRSWVPPLFLTNATRLAALCGKVTDPCPRTEDPSALLVTRSGDAWYLRAATELGATERGVPPFRAWRLSAGVTSWLGVLYWLVALTFAMLSYRQFRQKRQRSMAVGSYEQARIGEVPRSSPHDDPLAS